MAEPFLAELRLFSFNFAPKGWAMCNGQLLPINQNQALFSLLGTTYGGDGRFNFALPDLRSRVPQHFGAGFTRGEKVGEEVHTLNTAEIPQHTHFANASTNAGSVNVAAGNVLANSAPNNLYGPLQNLAAMAAGTVTNAGGGQAHENRQPYLVLNYCIALQGIFPSQN